MGTKNGSGFGSQFLINRLAFFGFEMRPFRIALQRCRLLAYGLVLFYHSTGFATFASISAGPAFASTPDQGLRQFSACSIPDVC